MVLEGTFGRVYRGTYAEEDGVEEEVLVKTVTGGSQLSYSKNCHILCISFFRTGLFKWQMLALEWEDICYDLRRYQPSSLIIFFLLLDHN